MSHFENSATSNLYDDDYEYKILKEFDHLFHDHDETLQKVDFYEDEDFGYYDGEVA